MPERLLPGVESHVRGFAVRQHPKGKGAAYAKDWVAVEEPLEIQVQFRRGDLLVTRSVSVTMRTPGADEALAAGFLYTEGLVHEASGILGIDLQPGRGESILVRLRDAVEMKRLDRNFYTASSCGVCGKASLDAIGMNRAVTLPGGEVLWTPEMLWGLPNRIREAQPAFAATGGLHAAALVEAGRISNLSEDVGRHNAVDKAIGARLLSALPDFSRALLFVSGRAGFELVQKAIMAGIPGLAAVGAPSSLAVDLARRHGLTLIGFLRDQRFNLYAGFERMEGGLDGPS
ncbi:MAG TPA: formate dehydrogenase accessory sulfurtransferase FdhD [Chthoniobacterales bacterium]